MAAMDDLKELCEHGSETIEVARDWELLSQAREILISHGYVEQEQQTGAEEEEEEEGDEAKAGIIFHRASRPDSSPKSSFRFPEKAPDPQYKSSGTRTSSSTAIKDWTLVKSFQHDTKQLASKDQISIIAKTPKLNLEQIVGIRMVVQPSVLLDNAHFNVKLRVERLVVGVHTNSFLKPEKHQELGFYPYSIRLDMEPLVEGYDNLCAIPIVETLDLQNCFPEICSSFRTTNTTVGGQIGYGPASLNISRTWGSQVGETAGKKVEVVRIDEAEGGNTASFEWSILRWASNEKYEAKKPDRGFKWNNGNLQLPFKGCAVSLESEIPDVWWKFEREMIGKVVKFRIRLQAEMHLMWWRKNSFIKSKGSLVNPFKYENVWELQQPSSE